MTGFTTISELARQVPGCRPRDISDMFYLRVLPDDKCPIVSGRRLIPNELVTEIRRLVRENVKRRQTVGT